MAAEKCSSKTVTCPYCGRDFEMKVWDSVNFANLPEAENNILKESFFNCECPHCGKKTAFIYPCLIHNSEKEYMIWFIPDGNAEDVKVINNVYTGIEKDAAYTVLGTFHDDLRYDNLRCVYTLPELREKIRINDEKLDDRVIEIIKLLLLAEMVADRKPGCNLSVPMFFTGTKNEDGIDKLEFSFRNGENLVSFSVSADIYAKTASNYADIIPPKTKEFKAIDRAWALSVV